MNNSTVNNFLVLSFFLAVTFQGCQSLPEKKPIDQPPKPDLVKTRQKAAEALKFCKSRKFNTDFCFLIDMSLHSGVKRFFIWDFRKDTITNSFLVSHGCCDKVWSRDYSKDAPVFSNKDGSHCSSLGKYKIGERAYSNWGIKIKYVLHGLEITNSNAQARIVVLHSWPMVPDTEIYPAGTPEGWGCPSVSNNSMWIIDGKLKSAKKPVLMWIYL